VWNLRVRTPDDARLNSRFLNMVKYGAGHQLDEISFGGIVGLRIGCKAAGQWHAPSLAVPWDAHIVKLGNSARLAGRTATAMRLDARAMVLLTPRPASVRV
jgi:hypothetical protein